ncbi:MAG: hypothetical protein ACI9MR_001882 [Myxococcota bacterium]|jgi:uncharacterized protein (TIGR01244 family)
MLTIPVHRSALVRHSTLSFFLGLVSTAWLLSACAATPIAQNASSVSALSNAHKALPGITTAAQPTPAALEAAKNDGYAAVINLRAADEDGTWDEAARAAALGMAYVNLPIQGAADLTEANARALARALTATPRPVLLHCSSGNRAGALLALKAHVVDGLDAEAALQLARDSGVTKLEPALRAALGLAD